MTSSRLAKLRSCWSSRKPTFGLAAESSHKPRKSRDELASIWKRMCHPRGVVKEFEDLRSEVERLAGSPGLAEYWRILREHGVEHPKRSESSQPARLFFSAWLARPPRDCR